MSRRPKPRWSWVGAQEAARELEITMAALDELFGSQDVPMVAALDHIELNGKFPGQKTREAIHSAAVYVNTTTAIFFWFAKSGTPDKPTVNLLHIVWETGNPPVRQDADWKMAESRYRR